MNNIYNIIGNDPYNLQLISDSLFDIQESTFENLYNIQKKIANINRFDFDMVNVTQLTNKECIYSINIEFIPIIHRNRFKQSKFYKKDLNIDIISENTNIFTNNIVIFINGELYTNYYVRAEESITNIVFKLYNDFPNTKGYVRDGFTNSEIRDLINNHTSMTIFIVKNFNTSTFNTNRMTLENYTFKDEYMGVNTGEFLDKNNIPKTDIYTSWITYDEIHLFKYKQLYIDEKNNKYYFNKDQVSKLKNTHTNIRNLFLLNPLNIITLNAGDEYFELPRTDMPIPIENILIFKKIDNDLVFDHDTTLTLYYPNIYKINQVSVYDLVFYVYYADDTSTIDNRYRNELKLYYRFNNNILDKYKNNTIPDIIKNFKPISITYDRHNYKVADIDHMKYKMDKLTDMIILDGNNYNIYLDKLVDNMSVFDIYVSEINNLDSRYRTDNKSEINDIDNIVFFDEPCYLFTFRYNSGDKMNILIDNYQTNKLYVFHDEKYCYTYIPTRLVNTNSIITIEKFKDYYHEQKIVIDDTDTYYKIESGSFGKVRASDIYVSTKSVSDDDIYLARTDYKLFTILDGQYQIIEKNNFYKYQDLYIKFINEIDIGKTVKVVINRVSFKQVVRGSNKVYINRAINNDKRNILLYRNGRLVPQFLRKYSFSDKISGPHIIKGVMIENPDDEYTLIYNTNKYILVYSEDIINTKGVVDLTDKIDKPIDFKWYDIYLNGLRLHKNNVEILGPYIFLIHDIPTLTNLEIYQKNLDSDYEFDTYVNEDISSKIYEEIKDTDIFPKLDDIEDIIPDIKNDIIIDIIDFFNEYLWTKIFLINPDLKQVPNSYRDKYPTIYDKNDNVFFNPDIFVAITKPVYMDPDKNEILLIDKDGD